MGIYVYTLRKKHVEAQLDGIYPIDVIASQYAYKDSYSLRYRQITYARRDARYRTAAKNAQQYYYDRVEKEFGTCRMHNFFFAMGGLEDGNKVYRMINGLPSVHDDDPDAWHTTEYAGRLFKLRSEWIVSKDCPKHKWYETCLLDDNITPVYQCERCDTMKEN